MLARCIDFNLLAEEETVIRYLILGIGQGLTEFLPVSSSGHLVLAQRFLKIDPPGVFLEAVLHLGTLVAVLVLFRRDLARLARAILSRGEGRKEITRLIVATVPIVFVGLFLRTQIEAAFTSSLLVGICLLITGGLLFAADRARRSAEEDAIRLPDALVIGFAQAAALLPGISRSGATIGTGMLLGIRGREAARFSFLLAIPAILAAGGFKLTQTVGRVSLGKAEWAGFLLGALAAAVVGALAIKGLLAIIARGKLKVFGIYCLALGLAAIIHANVG